MFVKKVYGLDRRECVGDPGELVFPFWFVK